MSEWKEFGFNNLYRINEKGEVWTRIKTRRHIIVKDGWFFKKPCFKRSDYTGAGYLCVTLKNSTGKYIRKGIHQLVAENFIPKIPGKSIVNHIDGNRENNHASNLEWATAKENTENAQARGAFTRKSSLAGRMDDCLALTVISFLDAGYNQARLAEILSCGQSEISRIKTKKSPYLKSIFKALA